MSQFIPRNLGERITEQGRMDYEAKREPGAPDWSGLPVHEQKLWEASVLDRPDLSLVELPTRSVVEHVDWGASEPAVSVGVSRIDWRKPPPASPPQKDKTG